MWQTIVAFGGLVVAVPTSVVAALSFRRTARVADVATTTAAQQVGLSYLKESLAAQQVTIVHQEGLLGELRGELKSCRDERVALAGQIQDLRRKMDGP